MKKLILIDSNALVHRAFHALPPTLTSAAGIPTNAIYGFTSVLLKMLKDLKPDYIAATFDLAGPTFRHDEFSEYKAHRVKAPDELYAQIPHIKEILKNFGIPIFEKPGYEADDLIGSLAEAAKKIPDTQVIIVTGDLDTLQLIDGDKVIVFTLKRGVTDTITYDEKEVIARYGLEPRQMIDFKALKGDPSDNIPGVPGIGEKTASTLIKEFETLENLYAVAEQPDKKNKILTDKLRAKLLENKDMAFFSKKLATIICNLDLDFNLEKTEWQNHLDLPALEKNLKDFGFYSLAKRVPESLGQPASSAAPSLFDAIEPTSTVAKLATEKDLKKASEIAVSMDPNNIEHLHLALSDEAILSLPIEKASELKDKEIIGHDIKPFIKELGRRDLPLPVKIFDTRIAAYLLNPDLRVYELSKVLYAELELTAKDNPELQPIYIWQLKNHLWDKLKQLNLVKVFEDIELPLLPVLAHMELTGILIDKAVLEKLLISSTKELSRLEKKIYELAGENFNINSPQQLGNILFEKLAIKAKVRKTGGGALSTAAPELEKIRELHPIIDIILEYRELQKLKTTYIEPFPNFIEKDGRVHTTYSQTVAATGRLASQDPNLQNIPIRTALGQEFRKAFIPQKGYSLVTFDYSQLELRIVAHIAQDEKMIAAFKNGDDIHTRTAAEIFQVKPQDVTKEMRRQAKVLNFGLIYGMGTLGFSRASGVNRNEAKLFIDKYFKEFSGVAKYMEDTKKQVERDGFVQTIFGRRRILADIHSNIPQLKAQAERMAINHPVQGTEADIMKLALIKVYDYLKETSVLDDAHMLLQVHDELVCEIKSDQVGKLAPKIAKIMEEVTALDVPLVVDVKKGSNWADTEKI